MANRHSARRRVILGCVLASTALAAPVLAQTIPAPAATGTGTDAAARGAIRPLAGSLTPSRGMIRTFWGDLDPFYGDTQAYWGGADPLGGSLTAFWGDIQPYRGMIRSFEGDLEAQRGMIRTFWGDLGAMRGMIRTFWDTLPAYDAAPGDYRTLAGHLQSFVGESEAFWGDAVTAETGRSFEDGFAAALFAKYGIDLSDPASLARLDEGRREMFFLDWYDGLMNFSGADHVDHWMRQIDWQPALTQTIGEGRDSVIGLLDFSVTGEGTQNIVKYDGISSVANGHGSAVASLMIAAHDGKGIMGIAPMASVVAYNPFDDSGTAGWSDVRNGVLMLSRNGASIINMSLGVPGFTLHQGWNTVFSDPEVAAATKGAVFVLAAGNDGSTQRANIEWNFTTNPNLIVVGSVDPRGTISRFSNRPGSACLLAAGTCTAGNALMDRFIVAPGELILVSDGAGGVTRMSGTSFAAPLVSGTVALIHDRWPWLASHPKETVDIILGSARDLGAPGVDPVYGVGQLDVTAALSPLSFNNLKWYQYDESGKVKAAQTTKIRNAGEQSKWEAKGMFFYAYEDIGATFRDFAIPLSSKLVGQTVLSAGGSREQFQSYLYSRMIDWMRSAPTGGKGFTGMTGFAQLSAPVRNPSGMNLSMTVAPRTRLIGYRQPNSPFQSALRLAAPGERFALQMGEGDGAVALGGLRGFGMVSDHDVNFGGVNPVLGMASGGVYGQAEFAVTPRLTVSAGFSQRTLKRDAIDMTPAESETLATLGAYRASAGLVSVRYRLNDQIAFTGSYTRLREDDALLGMQSLDPSDLTDGSTTEGLTFGGEAEVAPGLLLSTSATIGRTRQGSREQNIAVSGGGLTTSSFQIAASKARVFDGKDLARITFSQPMYLEHGRLDYTTVQVVDRQTGELGPVTQSFDVATQRRQFVAEMLYARSLVDGAAEMSLFGRAHMRADQDVSGMPSYMAGARFKLAF